jgi:hypothetical protein
MTRKALRAGRQSRIPLDDETRLVLAMALAPEFAGRDDAVGRVFRSTPSALIVEMACSDALMAHVQRVHPD